MIKHFTWKVRGTASNGEWETTGYATVRPGDFPKIFDVVMAETFMQLTRGVAIFGHPGEGNCIGPYDIRHVTIDQVHEEGGEGYA